ncbi:MAG TPA: PEP-CTERM sorting domain-containing protein [Bryobacteraceae bacterium]|jgi:hypothetical protein
MTFNRLFVALILGGVSLAATASANTLNYSFTFLENNGACSDSTFYNNSDQCYNYRLGETGGGNLQVDASLIDAVGPQSVSLSDLIADNAGTSFTYALTILPGNTSAEFTQAYLSSPVTFTFNDGLMTGISFTSGSPFGDPLSVTGATYEHRDSYNGYYYGPWTGQKTIIQMGTLSFAAPVGGQPTGTPEPSTWLLIVSGLAGAVAFRRRVQA